MLTLLVLCSLATAVQDSSASKPLVRVEPIPAQEDAGDPLKRVFAKEFDRGAWASRLCDPDLEARERSFTDLVRRARLDEVARAFLVDLSRDSSKLELAWTARLALRELDRGATRRAGVLPEGLGLDDRMAQVLQQLWRESPGLQFSTPDRPRLRISLPAGARSGRSVQVQQGEGGAKIVVTETVDGQESKREYEGKTLQEILDQNPELAGELHLSAQGIPEGFRVEWSPGPNWGLLDPLQYGDERGSSPEALREHRGLFSSPAELDPLFSPTEKSRAIRTDVLGVVVSPLSAEEARALDIPGGLRVLDVSRGTIASLLGIRKDDVLLQLNLKPLAQAQDITDEVGMRPADGALTVEWIDEQGARKSKTWKPGR